MTAERSKTAIVVGASGGIGLEIAKTYLARGFHVCGFYNTRASALDSFVSDGGQALQMNVTDEGSVANGIQTVVQTRSFIDVVAYSVTPAITNRGVLELAWNDFESHWDAQVKGLHSVVHALKNQIKARRPVKFVVILSDYCIGVPPASLAHYVTAKHALLGLSKALAADLARFGSTVNMISPGMVQTGLLNTLPPKLIELTADSNPLKRIATPKDVAGVAAFLASEDSDYLNGVNIAVNGGRIAL